MQEGAFQEAVETLVNGYFIIIVSKYARFFETKQLDKSAEFKGLDTKISLITTLMDHDMKIASILAEALAPYELVPQPVPCLTLFLKVDHIIGWYANVLHEEMDKVSTRLF
jgi:hypothetical protein